MRLEGEGEGGGGEGGGKGGGSGLEIAGANSEKASLMCVVFSRCSIGR